MSGCVGGLGARFLCWLCGSGGCGVLEERMVVVTASSCNGGTTTCRLIAMSGSFIFSFDCYFEVMVICW